jgi:hypothetical protein
MSKACFSCYIECCLFGLAHCLDRDTDVGTAYEGGKFRLFTGNAVGNPINYCNEAV